MTTYEQFISTVHPLGSDVAFGLSEITSVVGDRSESFVFNFSDLRNKYLYAARVNVSARPVAGLTSDFQFTITQAEFRATDVDEIVALISRFEEITIFPQPFFLQDPNNEVNVTVRFNESVAGASLLVACQVHVWYGSSSNLLLPKV